MDARREAREVVVVGAGPAGSATAARLASAGHDVLLLDRADFPRRKPCAECVNPAGVEALHRLGAWNALGGDGFDGCFPDAAQGIGIPARRWTRSWCGTRRSAVPRCVPASASSTCC